MNEKIAISLKYLSNFWENLEILLFNNKINLILIWQVNCVIGEINKKNPLQ